MKKFCALFSILLSLNIVCSTAMAAKYHHGLGVSFLTGFNDIVDLHENNLEAQGFFVSDIGVLLPIGLTYQPHYKLGNGIGIGAGIGPVMLIAAETAGDSSDFIFTNIPVNVDVRYTYQSQNSKYMPYAKAGIRKNFANGDFVVSGKAGLYVSLGIEFKTRPENKNSFTIEISFDKSEIEFEDFTRIGNTTIEASDTIITGLVNF